MGHEQQHPRQDRSSRSKCEREWREQLTPAQYGVLRRKGTEPPFTGRYRFDLNALFASGPTVARVPLFLLAIYLARGLPALIYVRLLGRSRAVIAGVLQATSLPFIVAATQIGLQLGVVTRASAAGLVAAGLLSVVISPALGLVLLRRGRPRAAAQPQTPSPVMPVMTAEDRALCRVDAAPSVV